MSSLLPNVSRFSALLLAVIAMSYALPAGYDKVFAKQVGNPLLFFSPLLEQFMYRESLGRHRFTYQSEDGKQYDRAGFESQLPFLYYKNLEKKKQLPVIVAGGPYDKEAIKAGKQGLDVKSRHLDGHRQQIELYPLFNNDPEVAIMPFPEDVFRFTGRAMEFVNGDRNRINQDLTTRFTKALQDKGFVFPATIIGGKTTNLKPFDEGYFVQDANGSIFHIKRILNAPHVVRTEIDPTLDVQDIIVSENRRREFYGTIVTKTGELFLISYDDYRLIPLPVEQYQPDRMDFKLLINPVHTTAVISDAKRVYGVAMDSAYQKKHSFSVERLDPVGQGVRIARDILFPFQLTFEGPYRAHADFQLRLGSAWSFVGIAMAVACYILIESRKKDRGRQKRTELVLVTLSGWFGCIALLFIGGEYLCSKG